MFEKLLDKLLRLLGIRKGHGFLPDVIEKDHWHAGDGNLAGSAKVIRDDGQWDNYLPSEELQKKRGIETMACTVFGTLNVLEILAKVKYDTDKNWCERYIGVLAGTTRTGNSPHRVAEMMRSKGNIDEILLPFNDKITSWSKYYSPKPMEKQYLDEGARWKSNWTFTHKWINLSSNSIMEALRYSPVGFSCNAWHIDSNGLYYRPQGTRDNHWVVCYGYVKGNYWKIFDSYEPYLKKVAWYSRPTFAKKYSLNKLKDDDMATTLKKKTEDEIYIVSGRDGRSLYHVASWNSYTLGVNKGWLKPFIEVDSLEGYEIQNESWAIIH